LNSSGALAPGVTLCRLMGVLAGRCGIAAGFYGRPLLPSDASQVLDPAQENTMPGLARDPVTSRAQY